jgi:tartrate-resistant acid phosphatase type 5
MPAGAAHRPPMVLVRSALCLCQLAAFSAPVRGFKFLSIGDWGDPAAKELNKWMGAESGVEFVIGIGDNFYSKGVSGIKDPQFKEKFEETFTEPGLNVSWYITAGNHDYYGGETGIKAEIEYSKHSSRWEFPDYYYDEKITAKDGTKVHVIAIDTWRLNGGDTFVKFDAKSGRMALHSKAAVQEALDSGAMLQSTYDTLIAHFDEEDPDDPIPWCGGGRAGGAPCTGDQEQLQWLEKVLMTSDADWKVVMGHFPIYSCTRGEHGETPKLIAVLDPILHKAKADMYFNGHDHILQHTAREGVHYFGSGAGAMKHTGVNAQYKGLMGYHESHYGFMVHEGNKTALTTTFVIDDGSKPYSYTIHKGVGHQRTGVAALRGGAPLEQRAAGNDGSLPRAHLPKSKGLTGPSRVKS